MKYCTKCILPETHDTVMFDEDGVCSVCRQIEYRDEKIDWNEREKELQELIENYKDRGEYDCIVPFSGGKDSTFQLWYIVKNLNLKPLVVRFDHWGYRPLVDKNNSKTFKILGTDILNFTPNWHVVRELMLESLKRRGDFCWHCHTGVYAHTMQIALRYNTPLIIWGESLAEYASWYSYDEMEEVDEKRFNRAMNLGMTADDMYEFLEGRVSKRDLYPFAYPPRKELMKIKCRSVCLGNYIKWDTKKQVEIIKKELGWEGQRVEGIPKEYDYEKIECQWQGVRDYCKYIKRGYGRTNHLACIDIRNGRLSREKGLEMMKEYDGKRPASLDNLLNILQITEEEFLEILQKHTVEPWKFNPCEVEQGEILPDMKDWDTTNVEGVKVGAKKKDKKTGTYI
jgi:N-acetyl sugar amidotransferase